MKHLIDKRKTQMKFIINKKSVSLTKEVTRTLAVVTSCCTNSVKFEKVTPKVPGYGCWPDVTLIASSCCSDGDVPTSGLGLSKDYYAFVLNLTSVQKFPQNSHRIHKNSAQFPYPSISIPYPYPSEFPYIYTHGSSDNWTCDLQQSHTRPLPRSP